MCFVQQLGQARLVERHLALAEPRDLVLVDVEADHLVAELDHADGMRRAQVARADDGRASAVPSFLLPRSW